MKTLFLNLPYSERIIRRYISSYSAPNFLFPPHELLSLATAIQKWKNAPVHFLDAIAEKKDIEQIFKIAEDFKPGIIVAYLGHFSITSDLKLIERIKSSFPEIKIVGTGYLSSIFTEEILKNSRLDIIIAGEPELTFSEVYDNLKNNLTLNNIRGVSFKDGENITINPQNTRIENLDELPFPDLSLLGKNIKAYNEPYLGKPFTTMTTSRGCPYVCSFCIHTYGNKIYYRSVENISGEIDHNLKNFGVKNIRFLDDTFTTDRVRTLEICKILKSKKINWTCLSRIDTLEENMAVVMKNSGCKRIYIGIESGSQKMLNILNKGIDKTILKKKLKQIKKSGLEISGFFITGIPEETGEDLKESIQLAKDADMDYIVVKKLKIWPGTELYKKYSDKINFSLFPFENRFKNPDEEKKALEREKLFYRKFYLRPKYIGKKLKNLIIHPREIITGFLGVCRFIFTKKTEKDFI